MSADKRKLESPQAKVLDLVEKIIGSGRMVVSEEPASMIDTIFVSIKRGDSATYYVSPDVYSRVMTRFWTPSRRQKAGLRKISADEAKRIKSKFSLDMKGCSFSAFNCEHCGHRYGMFEFVAQGIAEHGKIFVDAVLAGRGIAVVRVNPSMTPVCQNCFRRINKKRKKEPTGGGYYECQEYGCCYSN